MRRKNIYGIVGGMGPLASAEFVKTVYELSLEGPEQDAPALLLYSDPSVPDRTDAFLAGECEGVLGCLTEAFGQLRRMGADKIILCCVTAHYLLPRLSAAERAPIVSLLDVLADELEARPGRHLLLCTKGTRSLRLFEEHPRRDVFAERLVLPDEQDQERIHRDFIYPLKRNPDLRELTPVLEPLLDRYGVDSFAAGCTEIHLLAKHVGVGGWPRAAGFVDPLTVIAQGVAAGTL